MTNRKPTQLPSTEPTTVQPAANKAPSQATPSTITTSARGFRSPRRTTPANSHSTPHMQPSNKAKSTDCTVQAPNRAVASGRAPEKRGQQRNIVHSLAQRRNISGTPPNVYKDLGRTQPPFHLCINPWNGSHKSRGAPRKRSTHPQTSSSGDSSKHRPPPPPQPPPIQTRPDCHVTNVPRQTTRRTIISAPRPNNGCIGRREIE